ncbi:hypothetical protein PtB15_6B609 [Puccinia triticina]|nr:hypothetical protein PtB15_6B609 [Puccinia triticina]
MYVLCISSLDLKPTLILNMSTGVIMKDKDYSIKRPSVAKAVPVQQRPKWIRKRRSKLKPAAIQENHPTSIGNPQTLVSVPLIDLSDSIGSFPLIDYNKNGDISKAESHAQLNPLLEMIPLSDFGLDLLGQEPLFLLSKDSNFNIPLDKEKTPLSNPVSEHGQQGTKEASSTSSALILYGPQDLNNPDLASLTSTQPLSSTIEFLDQSITIPKPTDQGDIARARISLLPQAPTNNTSTGILSPALVEEVPEKYPLSDKPPVSETVQLDSVFVWSQDPENNTPAGILPTSFAKDFIAETNQAASISVGPQDPRNNLPIHDTVDPENDTPAGILHIPLSAEDSVVETKQAASYFVRPQDPRNNIPTHDTVPVLTDPSLPGFNQLSQSSLEYLPPSSTDSIFSAPDSTSELLDSDTPAGILLPSSAKDSVAETNQAASVSAQGPENNTSSGILPPSPDKDSVETVQLASDTIQPPDPNTLSPADTPAGILPPLFAEDSLAETAQAALISVGPQDPRNNLPIHNTVDPENDTPAGILHIPSFAEDSVVETKQAASYFVQPQDPRNNIPTHDTVPVLTDPSSPGFDQLPQSSLEYLPPSSTDSIFSAPGSTSELLDSALPNQLLTVEVAAQGVGAPLPSPENPVIPVATAAEPVPQSSESNKTLNVSIEPSSASQLLMEPSSRDSAPSTPAPNQSLETNHLKTPSVALPQGTTLSTTANPRNMTPPPVKIGNRTKKRLIIEDSDHDDDRRPVSRGVDVSPAAIVHPTTNAPPPAAIPASLPPAPACNSNSAAATDTRPDTADSDTDDISDWPDPEGKITAAQIRPKLKENGVEYKSVDSKTVLLAKYKLLYAEKRQPAQASLTAVGNQPSVEAQSTAAGLPLNETTKDIPLIDMDNCGTIPIQPLNPTAAQPTELAQSTSVISASRPKPIKDPVPTSRAESIGTPVACPRPKPVRHPVSASRPEPAQNPISASGPEPARETVLASRPNPFPDQVSSWASDVLMSHRDDKQVASSQPTQPNLESIVSSLHSLAQTSIQIGTASLNAMRTIAKGFTSLNSTIAALPLEGGANTQAPPSSRNPATRVSGRSRSQPISDNMDVDTPTTRSQGGAQNCEIQEYVRQHCATMFGRCAETGDFPPPATAEERRAWIRQSLADSSDEESDGEPDPIPDSSAMDTDEDFDPCFPYRDGPGHSRASPQALSIIWRAMRRAGVKSFWPDLSKAISSSVNRFLWDLARNTFMQVVRSGEYDPLTEELCDEAKIKEYFRIHIQCQLMRTYRERKEFSPEELAARQKRKQKNTRLATLKQWRLEEVLLHPSLIGLVPIIEQCCSDDETDDEADPSLISSQAAFHLTSMPSHSKLRNSKSTSLVGGTKQAYGINNNNSAAKSQTPQPEVVNDDVLVEPFATLALSRNAQELNGEDSDSKPNVTHMENLPRYFDCTLFHIDFINKNPATLLINLKTSLFYVTQQISLVALAYLLKLNRHLIEIVSTHGLDESSQPRGLNYSEQRTLDSFPKDPTTVIRHLAIDPDLSFL